MSLYDRSLATYHIRFLVIVWLVSTVIASAASDGEPKSKIDSQNKLPDSKNQVNKVTKTNTTLPSNTTPVVQPEFSPGSWSAWSSWSECSRSCGGGVAVQKRECLPRRRRTRTPQDKGVLVDAATNSTRTKPHRRLNRLKRRQRKDASQKRKSQCVGQYRRVQLCNDKACPSGAADFRAEQCSGFNNKSFLGRTYHWLPFMSATTPPCELNCRPNGLRFYATLNTTVIDGTPCPSPEASRTGSRAVCVAGICQVVGCNGVVGSKNRLNSCGLCETDDRQCRRIEGLFVRPVLSPGSNLMVTLPKGACNITVKQLKPSANLLAVRLRDGSLWYAGASSQLDFAGTRFTHLMATIDEGDAVLSPGPTNEPVDLMLIYHEPNRGIKYEYLLASTEKDDESEPETETPSGSTNSEKDFSISDGLVEEDDNGINVQDDDVRSNDVVGSRSDISFPFGADVQGTESHDPNRAAAAANWDAPSQHPRKRHYVWVAAPGMCSRPCGGGIQTQVLKCVREVDRLEVKEQLCYGIDRPRLRSVKCNTKPCQATAPDADDTKLMSSHRRHHQHHHYSHHSSNEWVVGPWSQCNGGTRKRTVMCRQSVGVLTGNVLSNPGVGCTMEDRPISVETCLESRDLQREHTSWFTSEWSTQCSSECGTGEQTRHVVCLARGDLCDEADRPASTRSCTSNQRCAPRWFAGAWGPCSANCGPGVQRRHIACLSWSSTDGLPTPMPLTACSNATRPDAQRACSDRPCPPTWLTSEWGQCSRSCGNGYQKREVQCSSEAHESAASIFMSPSTGSAAATGCLRHSRPLLRRLCNTHACPENPQNVIGSTASSPVSFGGRRSIPSKVSPDDPQDTSRSQKDSADGSSAREVCQDSLRNCVLAVQARLCKYPYYSRGCCASCRRHAASDRTLA